MSTTTTTAATTAALNSYLPVLARLLMCSLFIWDGVLQLRNPAAAVDYFTSVNVPVPHIAVWVSIAVHLLGGRQRCSKLARIGTIDHGLTHTEVLPTKEILKCRNNSTSMTARGG